MATLDYLVPVRNERAHRLLAEHLDNALRRGEIPDAVDRQEAEELIVKAVQQLLRRKRLKPEEAEELLARYGEYLTE